MSIYLRRDKLITYIVTLVTVIIAMCLGAVSLNIPGVTAFLELKTPYYLVGQMKSLGAACKGEPVGLFRERYVRNNKQKFVDHVHGGAIEYLKQEEGRGEFMLLVRYKVDQTRLFGRPRFRRVHVAVIWDSISEKVGVFYSPFNSVESAGATGIQ